MIEVIISASSEREFLAQYRIHDDLVYNGDRCWYWCGRKFNSGYGMLVDDKYRVAAHRYSYTRSKGVIPDGLVIDHLCSHILCVNPNHLEAVTQQQNIQRHHDRRSAREAATDYYHSQLTEVLYMANAAKKVRDNPIEYTLASYWAQWEFWKKSHESVPKRAVVKLNRWVEEMKLLAEFSDQLINDVERIRNAYLDEGVSLSRLGMIRVLLKEALAIRILNPDVRDVVDGLRQQYEQKLRADGASHIDPAAPPDGRKKRLLPDGSAL